MGTNVDTNADTDVQIKLILRHYKTENDCIFIVLTRSARHHLAPAESFAWFKLCYRKNRASFQFMKQKSGFVPFLSVKEEISYAVNRVGGFEVKWSHRGRLGYRKVVTNFFMSRCVCERKEVSWRASDTNCCTELKCQGRGKSLRFYRTPETVRLRAVQFPYCWECRLY